MQDNLGGGELDPAEGSASDAKIILLPFYPTLVRGQKSVTFLKKEGGNSAVEKRLQLKS